MTGFAIAFSAKGEENFMRHDSMPMGAGRRALDGARGRNAQT